MPKQIDPNEEKAKTPVIDLDSGDNNTVSNSTPPLIYLDSLEEVDSSKQEKHKSQKSPEV